MKPPFSNFSWCHLSSSISERRNPDLYSKSMIDGYHHRQKCASYVHSEKIRCASMSQWKNQLFLSDCWAPCLPVMEFNWRVCFVFDWPVLVQYIQVRLEDGRTSGLLLFSAQPFVETCVFVLGQSFLIKVWLMEAGGTLDGLTLRLVLTVAQPTGHTHTRPPFKNILIQEIKCIRHGVKKIQEGAENEKKRQSQVVSFKDLQLAKEENKRRGSCNPSGSPRSMSPWCQNERSYSNHVSLEGIKHIFVLLFNAPRYRIIIYITNV